MARNPTPWFREDRAEWCVNLNGQRHKLGGHPEGFPPPKKSKGRWNAPPPILQAFHTLMAKKPQENPTPLPLADALSVAEVYDKFLTWCRQHREPLTYQGYHDFIQSLLDHLKQNALLPVPELRPFHISEWVDRHPQWGPTRRRNAIIHVQRPFNWAYKLGYIRDNPIRHLEKPQARRRENHVTPQDFAAIIAAVKDQPFRDLLTFAWESGCRPQEARHIESRHVNLQTRRIEFPPAEAKGKKRWRIIRLNDKALAIVRRLVEDRAKGKLFVNTDGHPWNNQTIVSRFQRLKKKLGRAWAAYDFRHGFAQKMLENGVDHLAVAEIMGHANGQMLATVYSHMNKADDHLMEELRKASGEDSPA
jgi:integrase